MSSSRAFLSPFNYVDPACRPVRESRALGYLCGLADHSLSRTSVEPEGEWHGREHCGARGGTSGRRFCIWHAGATRRTFCALWNGERTFADRLDRFERGIFVQLERRERELRRRA